MSQCSHVPSSLTFERFNVTPKNEEAVSALLRIVTSDATTPQTIWICGDSQRGKTHLLHATRNAIKSQHRYYRSLYLRAPQLIEWVIKAISSNTREQLRKELEHIDDLYLDDLDVLIHAGSTQDEFLEILQGIHTRGGRIFAAGTQDIFTGDGYTARLKARFQTGMILKI